MHVVVVEQLRARVAARPRLVPAHNWEPKVVLSGGVWWCVVCGVWCVVVVRGGGVGGGGLVALVVVAVVLVLCVGGGGCGGGGVGRQRGWVAIKGQTKTKPGMPTTRRA